MSWPEVLQTGLNLVGSKAIADSARATGTAAFDRGVEQKMRDDMSAGQVVALGKNAAAEEIRQAKIVASRAVAVAAAGGYSQDIDYIIADIDGEGAYRAGVALYEAETQAEQLRFAGNQALQQGRDIREQQRGVARAAGISAFTNSLSAFSKFSKPAAKVSPNIHKGE